MYASDWYSQPEDFRALGCSGTVFNSSLAESAMSFTTPRTEPVLRMTQPRKQASGSFEFWTETPRKQDLCGRWLASWSFSFRKPRFTALRSAYNSAWVNAMNQPSIATMQDILIALDQDPNLQREFHKHLVEVIRRDDHLRQDLRKEILAEELLQLPIRFTRVEDDVAVLKQDVAVLKQDMAEVKQDMAEVKQDVAVLKGDMAEVKGDTSRMAGQIANLMGSDYETKAIERSRRLIRRALGMERATLVYASRQPATDFEEQVLVPAIRQGLIDRQQADQLEEADSIIRCENDQGDIIHAVVEISITVQDHDRARATDRAAIFNLATGLRVLPFVVGQNQQERGANAPNVPFLEYRE